MIPVHGEVQPSEVTQCLESVKSDLEFPNWVQKE